MRASMLFAALVAALALAGDAAAQTSTKGVTLPAYAGKVGDLTSNTHWITKITSWIPSFRSSAPPPGTMTMKDIPNPNAVGLGYLNMFGYRRMQ